MTDLYIGLMSGTSMDGIDAILARIHDRSTVVIARHEQPFPTIVEQALDRALDTANLSALESWRMDATLGSLFADAALGVLAVAGVETREVRAIGCHGQTVYHAPRGTPPLTIQLGDPNIIAARTGITTVADFRRRDLALGGEGAPLAPAFHDAMFRSDTEARWIVNVGGIANVSGLSRDPRGPALGFDTGPGNTLLDAWCLRHTGARYDRDGAWAGTGRVNAALLDAMLADPFFARTAPKSTGRETFHLEWLERSLERLPPIAPRDVQRTLVELTARAIADAARAGQGALECDAVYLCGGGAYNVVLRQALGRALGNVRLDTTQALGIEPKDVEGAAFGWLARCTLEGRAGNRTEVTGASAPAVLGAIYPGALTR